MLSLLTRVDQSAPGLTTPLTALHPTSQCLVVLGYTTQPRRCVLYQGRALYQPVQSQTVRDSSAKSAVFLTSPLTASHASHSTCTADGTNCVRNNCAGCAFDRRLTFHGLPTGTFRGTPGAAG